MAIAGPDNFSGGIFWSQVPIYFAGELVGAFIGAIIAWLAFKDHFDAEEDPGKKLAVFSTGPAIRSYAWNTVTEVIGTFVLVFVILMSRRHARTGLGPLSVALLVVGIGASLGGPTGYAINPARDLGPRIAHASCRSRARAARIGAIPGFRSSVRSSAVRSLRSPSWPSAGSTCSPSSDRDGRPNTGAASGEVGAPIERKHCPVIVLQDAADERDVSADE